MYRQHAMASVSQPNQSDQQRLSGVAEHEAKLLAGAQPEPAAVDTRTQNWSCAVNHCAVTALHVQLVASAVKVRCSTGTKLLPRCSIEVWAQGGPSDSEQHKLATGSGSVCPKNDSCSVHVSWLGRLKECPFHTTQGDRWRFVVEGTTIPNLSLAQALLGVLAAVGSLFGVCVVELGAEDNGSGKLVQFYLDLGFTAKKSLERFVCGELPMHAPMEAVSRLAPAQWLQDIVPKHFDAWPWFWSSVEKPKVEEVLSYIGIPHTWSWKLQWPLGARVEARLLVETYRIVLVVHLRTRDGDEMAYARGGYRVGQSMLRILWFGRSDSQAVHSSVRGHSLQGEVLGSVELAPATGDAESTSHGSEDLQIAAAPTVAMAMVGILCVLARWFDCKKVEMTVLDNGSGRLIRHLSKYGFSGVEVDHLPTLTTDEPVSMSACCKKVAMNCCPKEWQSKLPAERCLGALSRTVVR